MKKPFIFLGLTVLLASLFVGCGQRGEEAAGSLLALAAEPAIDTSGVSFEAELSLTLNYPFDPLRLPAVSQLFSNKGAFHTAGDPAGTLSLSLSSDNKTITVKGISGWSALLPNEGPKWVDIRAPAAVLMDKFGAEGDSLHIVAEDTILWRFRLKGIAGNSISGQVTSSGSGLSGVNITITGENLALPVTVETDASGEYIYSGLANGTYEVTAAKTGYVFSPASSKVFLDWASSSNNDFSASLAAIYSISGTVTGTSGVTVNLTGAATQSAAVAVSGDSYQFNNLTNGTYYVIPSKEGYYFTPASYTITIEGTGSTGNDFSAGPAYSVSGHVTYPQGGSAGVANVLVTLEGSTRTTTTDANGYYSLGGVAAGAHTLRFYKNGWTFYPSVESFTTAIPAVTKNATTELTNFVLDSSGAAENLYTVVYDSGFSRAAAGGDNSAFLWNSAGWSQPGAAGLPSGKKLVWSTLSGAASALVILEDGPVYLTSDSGSTFAPYDPGGGALDLSSGDPSIQVKSVGSIVAATGKLYVLDGSDGNLQYTESFGAGYPGNANLPSGTFNAVMVLSEEDDSTDYNSDGDMTDIMTWLVGDNGLVYYSDDTSGLSRNWTRLSISTSANLSGVYVDSTSGTNFAGYIVSAGGGLYAISGDMTNKSSFSISEVFSGTPYVFNNVTGTVGSTTYVVGNGGKILKDR